MADSTPNRPPLSPAAQAVMDAANGASSWGPDDCLNDAREITVAALRAAADHAVPEDPEEAMHFTTEAIRLNRMSVRATLLAIAAELEGQQ